MAIRAKSSPLTSTQVFLYLPNMIGYVRIMLTIVSQVLMSRSCCAWATLLYLMSCLLDAADGHAARSLGQCSRFGAVLDMVIDRSTTSILLCHLCVLYPHAAPVFQILLALDLSSHYMHMASSLTAGSPSHKKMSGSEPLLLRAYYSYRPVLFIVCAMNELFLVFLYILYYTKSTVSADSLAGRAIFGGALVCFPVFLFKQVVNVIQLVNASQSLVLVDIAEASRDANKQS